MFMHTPLLEATNTLKLGTELHSVSEPTTGHYYFSLRTRVELQSSLGLSFKIILDLS